MNKRDRMGRRLGEGERLDFRFGCFNVKLDCSVNTPHDNIKVKGRPSPVDEAAWRAPKKFILGLNGNRTF